jgi:hypothetical protein
MKNLFVQDFCIHPYVYVHMSIHIDVYVWACARILNECILRNIVFFMHKYYKLSENHFVFFVYTLEDLKWDIFIPFQIFSGINCQYS